MGIWIEFCVVQCDELSGLAGTHVSWDPQIRGLVGTVTPNDDESPSGDRSNESGGEGADVEVCAFDNRGMGRSSVPTKNSEYR